jgi:hypothetical protein
VPDDSEKLVDPLVLNLARAFRWQELIDSGTYSNAIELARAIGKDTAYVARTVRLTLLAPEIIHAILHGTLKKSISMETLRKAVAFFMDRILKCAAHRICYVFQGGILSLRCRKIKKTFWNQNRPKCPYCIKWWR